MILVVLFFGMQSIAYAYNLQNTQIQNTLSGEKHITDVVGVRGAYTFFTTPSDKIDYHFFHFGPTFNITDWFWIAPQVGYIGLWDDDKNDAYMTSVLTMFLIKKGMISIITESDAIFYGDKIDYYGYYTVDLNTPD